VNKYEGFGKAKKQIKKTKIFDYFSNLSNNHRDNVIAPNCSMVFSTHFLLIIPVLELFVLITKNGKLCALLFLILFNYKSIYTSFLIRLNIKSIHKKGIRQIIVNSVLQQKVRYMFQFKYVEIDGIFPSIKYVSIRL